MLLFIVSSCFNEVGEFLLMEADNVHALVDLLSLDEAFLCTLCLDVLKGMIR